MPDDHRPRRRAGLPPRSAPATRRTAAASHSPPLPEGFKLRHDSLGKDRYINRLSSARRTPFQGRLLRASTAQPMRRSLSHPSIPALRQAEQSFVRRSVPSHHQIGPRARLFQDPSLPILQERLLIDTVCRAAKAVSARPVPRQLRWSHEERPEGKQVLLGRSWSKPCAVGARAVILAGHGPRSR